MTNPLAEAEKNKIWSRTGCVTRARDHAALPCTLFDVDKFLGMAYPSENSQFLVRSEIRLRKLNLNKLREDPDD